MNLAELSMKQGLKDNSKTEKKYYFIYARKSEESEDRQVQSIDDQLREAEEIKLRKNISTIATFSESMSAKKPGRPEFNRMVESIYKRHDIKGIIVWKLNRLSRNPVDEGTIRWLLQSGEIKEIITSERTYTEADSDFNMAIEGAQAQRFISDLRKDSARGTKNKIEKGIAPILAPPGYVNDKTKNQGERDILPHPVQFALVRKVFDLYLTGNYSVQQLWFKAQELGVRSNRGKIVSKTQLYKMLGNPFYTGTRFIYADKLYANGVHERMITDDEFDLVQEIMSKRTHPRGYIHTDLLTGLMTCGGCGRGITARVKTKHYKNGSSQVFVYYSCTRKLNPNKCFQPAIRAEVLEKQVLAYLDKLQLSDKFIAWAIKWLKEINLNQNELREAKFNSINQSYIETVKKLERLVDLMISGVITTEEGTQRKQILEQEKSRLHDSLTNIDANVTDWMNLAVETFRFVKSLKERYADGTIDQKKSILRIIGSELILKDKKLRIEVRTPFKYVQEVAYALNDRKLYTTQEKPVVMGKTLHLSKKDKKWVEDGCRPRYFLDHNQALCC